MPNNKIIKPHRGKASVMASNTKKDMVLENGELFIEIPDNVTDNNQYKIKVGDGSTTYENLKYAFDPSSIRVDVDDSLSDTSTNPVQNKVVKGALDNKQDSLTFDSTPTANSDNPVTSGGIKTALDGKLGTGDISAWAKESTKPSYTASEVGLGNVGNFKAVSTVASQGLTDTEKSNARSNIGAGTSSFSGNYSDLSGLPTLGTASGKDVPTSGNATSTQVVMGNDSRLTDARNAADVSAWAKESTKPSYTASEVGLGNVGNFKAVSTEASQGLTDTEKSNARTNIGAGTSSFSGNYSDLSGLPTLGTASGKDVPTSGNATSTQVVMGNDSRLTDARNAADVSAWAKASTKPSYTATEVGAIASTEKGAASGVAELDANGKVPSSQLPSFVDDVLEYTSISSFPATGESGKIYVDTTTNLSYRWSGTTYTEISPSIALGETESTAYRGDRGKIAYDHSQSTHARTDATKVESSTTNGNIKINGTETTVYTHPGSGTNPHGTTASDIGLGNVGNFKAVSTVASQGLTDTEKSNARSNIGAGTSSFSGSYSDLSNKPTLGTASGKDVPTSGNATSTQVVMGNDSRLTDARNAADVSAWAKASTKPSYTASEVGLGNVGNFKAVSTVASQGLTDTEKSNARANIGAGTSSFSGNYNDLSNKPTVDSAPTSNSGNLVTSGGVYSAINTLATNISNGTQAVGIPVNPTTTPTSNGAIWITT